MLYIPTWHDSFRYTWDDLFLCDMTHMRNNIQPFSPLLKVFSFSPLSLLLSPSITHTHTHTRTCTHKHTHLLETAALSLTHTHTHTHTLGEQLSLSLSLSSFSLSLSISQKHAYTYLHTHTHTLWERNNCRTVRILSDTRWPLEVSECPGLVIVCIIGWQPRDKAMIIIIIVQYSIILQCECIVDYDFCDDLLHF